MDERGGYITKEESKELREEGRRKRGNLERKRQTEEN
jgi:hypothetical protein